MEELKIKQIDVFKVDLPYSGGTYYLSGGRTYSSFDATFVRITTNTGIEGWGESTPFGATYIAAHALGVRAAIQEMAPHLIGLDPRRVDRVYDKMDAVLVGHESSKAALDIACWDIFGKATGLPVCELLGGRTDNGMPIISSLNVGTPAQMREQAAKYRAKGYMGHSVKVAGDDPATDVRRIAESLADRQPGEFYLVDGNGGLTPELTLRMLRLLPPGLDFVLEAPCATWRENMTVRRQTDVPMIFDELATTPSSIVQMIADDAGDGINLKITKAGGLTGARKIRDICIAAGYFMSVMDTVGSDFAYAAIVQLAQTIPERSLRCVLECRDMVTLKTADGVGEGAFDLINGRVTAPTAPGLGVKPRMDVLGEPVLTFR